MNIKNRLEKVETILNPAEFCVCPATPKHEITFRLDGKDTQENQIADYCDYCRKPIDKTKIIVEYVEAEI
jgi:hypothetical protein